MCSVINNARNPFFSPLPGDRNGVERNWDSAYLSILWAPQAGCTEGKVFPDKVYHTLHTSFLPQEKNHSQGWVHTFFDICVNLIATSGKA